MEVLVKEEKIIKEAKMRKDIENVPIHPLIAIAIHEIIIEKKERDEEKPIPFWKPSFIED